MIYTQANMSFKQQNNSKRISLLVELAKDTMFIQVMLLYYLPHKSRYSETETIKVFPRALLDYDVCKYFDCVHP